jgi:hypothetical protein
MDDYAKWMARAANHWKKARSGVVIDLREVENAKACEGRALPHKPSCDRS